MTIRQLRPGESIPPGEPKRYRASSGYIRLRWTVAPGEQVEVYEHRVLGDRVTTAEHVHHRNGIRDDNRPENLEQMSSDAHAHRHGIERRKFDPDEAVRLYESGLSTVQVGKALGVDPATVWRCLDSLGVKCRRECAAKMSVDLDELRRLHAEPGMNAGRIGRVLGVSAAVVRARMSELGLAPFSPGRPPGRSVHDDKERV